jgi:DNA-directed RNA polymerase subunit H
VKILKVKLPEHILIPKHELLNKEEKVAMLEKCRVTKKKLPKILSTDPMVKLLGAKPGDIIRIRRDSPVAGKVIYYRLVVKA